MSAPDDDGGVDTGPFRFEDFDDPIQFVYGEHERVRAGIERLEELAADPAAPTAAGAAAAALELLENFMPRHIADEEEDLFPLLERRCTPEDKVEAVVKLLQAEHREDVEVGRALIEPLRLIADGKPAPDPILLAHHMRAFALLQRRHQAMENNVVLPFAFERLTDDDKTELARRMAARRGLFLPPR